MLTPLARPVLWCSLVASILGLISVCQADTPRSFYEATARMDLPETERIQNHFDRLIPWLTSRSVTHLSSDQQRARAENLARLAEYRDRGLFPINPLGLYAPTFIDDRGTVCAVGHLMIESGAASVADDIARRQNHAYLFDIDTAGAAEWITRSGLTPLECAMIQPTYQTNCASAIVTDCQLLASGEVLLEWTNGEPYTSIDVHRDSDLIATVTGGATSFVDTDAPNGDHWYSLRPWCGNEDAWVSSGCTVTVETCEPVVDLNCQSAGADVLLSWSVGEIYDSIEIHRNDDVLAVIAGNTNSYVDVGAEYTDYFYQVRAICPNGIFSAVQCYHLHSEPVLLVRGDCQDVGVLNVADAVTLFQHLFVEPLEIPCLDACDANDDGSIDVSDPIMILLALFVPGASALTGQCEEDSTDDALDCAEYTACP